MGEHNPAELEYGAPNGCKIRSLPAQFEAAEGVVICDGYSHRVFNSDGTEIGQAGTLGLARLIARNGGPLPVPESTKPGGSKKGRKK
jgi:hypothetical protein